MVEFDPDPPTRAYVDLLKEEIASLRSKLASATPVVALSSGELSKAAGISRATAHRFKRGKPVDIPTAKKLMSAGFIKECPCCGKPYDGDANG